MVRRVPRVSAFYGIVIAMYFDEHGVPHFHARYAGQQASVAIAKQHLQTEERLAQGRGVVPGAKEAKRPSTTR